MRAAISPETSGAENDVPVPRSMPWTSASWPAGARWLGVFIRPGRVGIDEPIPGRVDIDPGTVVAERRPAARVGAERAGRDRPVVGGGPEWAPRRSVSRGGHQDDSGIAREPLS